MIHLRCITKTVMSWPCFNFYLNSHLDLPGWPIQYKIHGVWMPKGKIQMQSCGCPFHKRHSQLKPHRYWMPVEEKEVKQLPVFAGSRRNVSSAKELCGNYSISQHSRSPGTIWKLKGIWEVHWFMLAYEPRACSPSQITCASNWGNHLLRGVYPNQRCTATARLFGS